MPPPYASADVANLMHHVPNKHIIRSARAHVYSSGNILRGFKMPFGSIVRFSCAMSCRAAGGCDRWSTCRFSAPTPCSALTLPPLSLVHSYTKGSRMGRISCRHCCRATRVCVRHRRVRYMQVAVSWHFYRTVRKRSIAAVMHHGCRDASHAECQHSLWSTASKQMLQASFDACQWL